MLDVVTAALAAIGPTGAFATEIACASDDLHIEVEGVGPLRFPVSAATARKLCAVARQAPFGRRDRTLYDASVRDTWEIDASRVLIEDEAWQRAFAPQLDVLRERLGLPEEGTLEAEPDKLLVYGPGQFFASHQDSERSSEMVGSVVVDLPSKHAGGAVVVEHRGEKMVFTGAKRGPRDLSILAFYADCHHEVKPVASGYRIALTYRLLYSGGAKKKSSPLSAAVIDRLATSVEAYFSTPVPTPYASSPRERPKRLIYLLDHEYTQQSLRWDGTKGADRSRVDALLEVAERLDCEAYLALADVHEAWQCEEEYWGEGYGGRYDDEDDEDDEDEIEIDEEGYELIDLIDSDVELRHWIGADGKPARSVSTSPPDTEVCFTRPTTEMKPFKSEHEGYMGNYGNTVERWYHRAAFVMWPRSRAFAIRAEVSPVWAVNELARRIKAGAGREAHALARELLPMWSWSAPKEPSSAFVQKLLDVLVALNDAELASGLLAPLGPHRLTPTAMPAFAALVEQRGLSWSQKLFQTWEGGARYDTPRWLRSLPALCEALVAGGEHGKALAPWLLAREVASFEQRLTGALDMSAAFRGKGVGEELDDAVVLLETAAVIGAPALRDELVAFLTAPKTALPLLAAGALLQKARKERKPAAVRTLGLSTLASHVEDALREAIAAPERSPDDWSIEPPARCSCALCKQLATFLRARDQLKLEWPLAKERRRHIHEVIDRHGLPVTHTTIRRGSPQTLVLVKQPALFEREAAQRAGEKALLAWLVKQRTAFGEEDGPARAPR